MFQFSLGFSTEQWLGRTLETRVLLTGMVALFGGASLLLACLGLYGVVSYTAALRAREFGVRMALGASAGNVRSLVLGHAGKLALCGAAIGLACSWPVGRALESMLFGITVRDKLSWLLGPGALVRGRVIVRAWPGGKSRENRSCGDAARGIAHLETAG